MAAISKPTLLIDKDKCRQNIARIAEKAKASNTAFRPHFKTHQSAEIGEMFREFGINGITVSSVNMAQYFAKAGWRDITIAFPVNLLEIDTINQLAKDISLKLLISDIHAIDFLLQHLQYSIEFYIEVDTGQHRSGFPATELKTIRYILDKAAKNNKLLFRGFYSHPGHTYQARGEEEILSTFNKAKKEVTQLATQFTTSAQKPIVALGDTPGCSVANIFTGVDEISPGNFLFYDLQQLQIGSCSFDDIAVAVLCPIVSVYPERSELIIYGGAVHFSKDFVKREDGSFYFGLPVLIHNNKWNEALEGCYVKSLSQEHGILKATSQLIAKVKPGDIIGILPAHSCLTADLLIRK